MADSLFEILLYLNHKDIARLAMGKESVSSAIIQIEANNLYWMRRLQLYYPDYTLPVDLNVNPRLLYDVLQMVRGSVIFSSLFEAMVEMSDYYTNNQLVAYIYYMAQLYPELPKDTSEHVHFIKFIAHRSRVLLALFKVYPILLTRTIMTTLAEWDAITPTLAEGLLRLDSKNFELALDSIEALRYHINDVAVGYMISAYLNLGLTIKDMDRVLIVAFKRGDLGAIKILSKLENGPSSEEMILEASTGYAASGVMDYILSLQSPKFRIKSSILIQVAEEGNDRDFKLLFPLRASTSDDIEIMKEAISTSLDDTEMWAGDIVEYMFSQGVEYPDDLTDYIRAALNNTINVQLASILLTKGSTIKSIAPIRNYVTTHKVSAANEVLILGYITNEKLASAYYNDIFKRRKVSPVNTEAARRSTVPSMVKLLMPSGSIDLVLENESPAVIRMLLKEYKELKSNMLGDRFLSAISHDNIELAQVFVEDGRANPFQDDRLNHYLGSYKHTHVNVRNLKLLLSFKHKVAGETGIIPNVFEILGQERILLDVLLMDKRFQTKTCLQSILLFAIQKQLTDIVAHVLATYGLNVNDSKGNLLGMAVKVRGQSYNLTQLLLQYGAKPANVPAELLNTLPEALRELL